MTAGAVALFAALAAASAARLECDVRNLGSNVFGRATVRLDSPPAAVWAVVTDYESLPVYVSAVDSSRVLARDSTGVVVRQVGTARLVVAHAVRLVLRFHETPPRLLRYEVVRGDFPVYYGTWRFEPEDTGTRFTYDLTFRPPAWLPRPIVKAVLERVMRRMLTDVRAEVDRRAALQP